MIMAFRCNKCKIIFSIDKSYIKNKKVKYPLLSCPICHHFDVKIMKRKIGRGV